MISALDSSVILDVLTDDSKFAGRSEILLRRASSEGQLVVGECVLAEISPAFESQNDIEQFLADWQIKFIPSEQPAALLAGKIFARYLKRGGKHGRVVADFLIAAHARLHADRLIARDRGYVRDYFADLKVLDPGA